MYKKIFILEKTCLNNQGVRTIAKGNWPKIKYVDITNNKIGFLGYESLVWNNWKKIEKIFIG